MAQFRSFWYRGALSPYEHLCLKSFVAKGHDFTLYSYDKIEVPRGVRLEDAYSMFSKALLHEAYALGKNPDWGQCGPILVTRVVKELLLGRFAVPTNRFYPLH